MTAKLETTIVIKLVQVVKGYYNPCDDPFRLSPQFAEYFLIFVVPSGPLVGTVPGNESIRATGVFSAQELVHITQRKLPSDLSTYPFKPYCRGGGSQSQQL